MFGSSTVLERRPAHIDPRIRARRIEVQRGTARRRLQRLVEVGLVLAVAAAFAGALRSPLLDVDEVRVQGNQHTPTDLVLERAGIGLGDQLMDVDLRASGTQVATLPWIDDVRLRRHLDGGVALRVTERTPVAVVGEGAGAVLVDRAGRALARSDDEPALATSLARLADVPTPSELGMFLPATARGALEVAHRLAAAEPGLLRELSAGDELVGTLSSGLEVRFGAATELDAKARSLRTVLDQVDLSCAALIDVRSPSSPVLTREEGCS